MEQKFELTITIATENMEEATLEQYIKSLLESGPVPIITKQVFAEECYDYPE